MSQGAPYIRSEKVRDHHVWTLRVFRDKGERYVSLYGARFYLPSWISSTFEFHIPYTHNHPASLPQSWRRDL
jgi:hypothetical protein